MPNLQRHRGFTLIEVMMTIAIIAILSAIALPSYRDHVIRGQLVDVTNGLEKMHADMQQHFNDNRTFATAGARVTPCQRPAGQRTFGKFVVSCMNEPDATTYLLIAQGSADMSAFGFTVNQANQRATTTTAKGWEAADSAVNTCWVLKKGQKC